MARKHKLEEVLRALSSKNDCRINGYEIKVLMDEVWDKKEAKYVRNPRKYFDLGNGSWGKISYLQKEHGYRQIFVGEF